MHPDSEHRRRGRVEERAAAWTQFCTSASLLLCSSVLGCHRGDAGPPDGSIEADWTGADTGSFRGTATVRWCAASRFAEVLGVRGDTGIAIAIRHVDSLLPGRYPAVHPDSADSVAVSSTVALRFLARASVSGYQSDSGSVVIRRDEAGRLGADFDVRARILGSVGRIHLRGRATAAPVLLGGDPCSASWEESE